MFKWDEKYARKADAFACTETWQAEANHILNLPQFPKKGVVLDFACNTGRFLELCVSTNLAIKGLGVDVNTEGLAIANKRMPEFTWETDLSSVEDESVDYVVFLHGINQVEDLDRTLSEIWRVMKQGAYITVTTHNPTHFKVFGLRNLFNGYLSDVTIKREPYRGQLKQMMWDNGFICKDTYWFGTTLVPFLKNRIVFNGRKGKLNET